MLIALVPPHITAAILHYSEGMQIKVAYVHNKMAFRISGWIVSHRQFSSLGCLPMKTSIKNGNVISVQAVINLIADRKSVV